MIWSSVFYQYHVPGNKHISKFTIFSHNLFSSYQTRRAYYPSLELLSCSYPTSRALFWWRSNEVPLLENMQVCGFLKNSSLPSIHYSLVESAEAVFCQTIKYYSWTLGIPSGDWFAGEFWSPRLVLVMMFELLNISIMGLISLTFPLSIGTWSNKWELQLFKKLDYTLVGLRRWKNIFLKWFNIK